MRGIVFAVMLIAGVAFGASGASAQSEYTNIGGDLNWPATPSVEEQPAARPQIGNASTARGSSRREPSASSSSAQTPGQGAAQASQGQGQGSQGQGSQGQSGQSQGGQATANANSQAYDDDATGSMQGRRRRESSEPETEKLPPVPMRAVRVMTPPAAIAVVNHAAPSEPASSGPSQASPVAATLAAAPPAVPREVEPAVVAAAPVEIAPTAPAALAPAPVAPPPATLALAPAPEPTPDPKPEPKPDPMIARMAGQMLIVGFDGAAPDDPSTKQIIAQIEAGRIGGVLVANRNVQSPAQLTKLMNALRRTKTTPAPFLAVEQEGGAAQALTVERGFRAYPSARDLGETNDPLIAYSVYQTLASELAGYGFNLNLGPVVDVQQGAEAAEGDERRSYGPQPKHVAAFAKAFRIAHHDAGLLTALKHFPGQGSMREAPDAPADIEAQWADAALEPYRELVDNGSADIVMMGHLTHSSFADEPGMPASLSEKAVKRLREDVGFDGVVLSDDIEAGAVSKRFPLEERVLRAIMAGGDLLLIGQRAAAPADLPDRIAAIIGRAIITGTLSRDQLQASYDRIIALKQRLGPAAQALAAKRDSTSPASPAPAQ